MRRRTVLGAAAAMAPAALLGWGSPAFANEQATIEIQDPGASTDGYEVIGLDRPVDPNAEDEPANGDVPPGSQHGDLVWVQTPGGNAQLFTVVKRPSLEHVPGYAGLGASIGAMGKLTESRLKGENVVQQTTAYLLGGAVGFVTGGLTGGVVAFKDPTFFLIPGDHQHFVRSYFTNPNVGLYDARLGPLNWR